MALVQKLESGGESTFRDKLNTLLLDYGVHRKHWPEAVSVASEFYSAVRGNTPTAEIKFTDLGDRYTISSKDGNELKPYFQGADKIGPKKILGFPTVGVKIPKEELDRKKLWFSLAAKTDYDIQQEAASKSKKDGESRQRTKLPTFSSYLDSTEGLRDAYNSGRKDAFDDSTGNRNYDLDFFNQNINKYLESYNQNKDKYDFADYDFATKYKDAISSGNYDEAASLLRDKNIYLPYTSENIKEINKARLEEEKKRARSELDKKYGEVRSRLEKLNLSPDFAWQDDDGNIKGIVGEWERDKSWLPESIANYDWAKEFLKDRDLKVLRTHDDRPVVIKGNELFKFDPQRGEAGYGYQIDIDPNTYEFKITTPEDRHQEFVRNYSYEPEYKGQWRKVLDMNSIKGYPGYSVYMDPKNPDNLLLAQSGRFFPRVHLTRGDEGWVSDDGAQVDVPAFFEFSQDPSYKYISAIEFYGGMEPKNLPISDQSPEKWKPVLEDYYNKLKKSLKTGVAINGNQATWSYYLMYALDNAKKLNLTNDDILKYEDLLLERNKKLQNSRYKRKDATIQHKYGGILKGEKGLTFEEYSKILSGESLTDAVEDPGKVRDVTNTWANLEGGDKALSVASTAGMAASFVPIPIVGAIGGAVMLGADAWKGFRRGWTKDDYINLGVNASILALGLAGLGGAGSAAKIAKGVSTGSKVAKNTKAVTKIASNINKGTKEAKILAEVGMTADTFKTASKLTNAEKAVEIATKIDGSIGKISKTSAKKIVDLASPGVKIAEDQLIPVAAGLVENSLHVLGDMKKVSRALPGTTKAVGKAATYVGDKVGKVFNSKTGKYVAKGLGAAQIGSGAIAGYNIGKDWVDTGSFAYTNPTDLKRLVAAGAVTSLWRRNWLAGRALKLQSEPVSKTGATTTFKTTDGTTHTVQGEFRTPVQKTVPIWKRLRESSRTKVETANKEAVEKFTKSLAETASTGVRVIETKPMNLAKGKSSIIKGDPVKLENIVKSSIEITPSTTSNTGYITKLKLKGGSEYITIDGMYGPTKNYIAAKIAKVHGNVNPKNIDLKSISLNSNQAKFKLKGSGTEVVVNGNFKEIVETNTMSRKLASIITNNLPRTKVGQVSTLKNIKPSPIPAITIKPSDIDITTVGITPGSTSGLKARDFVNYTEDYTSIDQAIRDHEFVKRAIERGLYTPMVWTRMSGRPRFKFMYKDGGILKLQKAGTLDFSGVKTKKTKDDKESSIPEWAGDYTTLFNTAGYLGSTYHNKLGLHQLIKGLESSKYRESTLPYISLPTPPDNSLIVEKELSKEARKVKDIASATSDSNQATAIQLEHLGKARSALSKAMAENAQIQYDAGLKQQMQNFKTTKENLAIIASNAKISANAEAKKHQVTAEYHKTAASSLNNFIKSLIANKEDNKASKMFGKIVDIVDSKDYKDLLAENEKYESGTKLDELRANWEKGKPEGVDLEGGFEESIEYKNYQKEKDRISAALKVYNDRVNSMQMRMMVLSKKQGGLIEKLGNSILDNSNLKSTFKSLR